MNLVVLTCLNVRHVDVDIHQEKEQRKERDFLQIPNAKIFPAKCELVMKWLHNIRYREVQFQPKKSLRGSFHHGLFQG